MSAEPRLERHRQVRITVVVKISGGHILGQHSGSYGYARATRVARCLNSLHGRSLNRGNSGTPTTVSVHLWSSIQHVFEPGVFYTTGSGIVDIDDLLAVINAWGQCP
jgi:hypothetical protein